MKIDMCDFNEVHPLGESATHPIERLATRLGVLFLLAGKESAAPPVAHSGAFN